MNEPHACLKAWKSHRGEISGSHQIPPLTIYYVQLLSCTAARLHCCKIGIMMMQKKFVQMHKSWELDLVCQPCFPISPENWSFIKTQQFQLLSEFMKSLCWSKLFVGLEADTHFLALNAYSLTYFQVLLHGEIWYVWWKCTQYMYLRSLSSLNVSAAASSHYTKLVLYHSSIRQKLFSSDGTNFNCEQKFLPLEEWVHRNSHTAILVS